MPGLVGSRAAGLAGGAGQGVMLGLVAQAGQMGVGQVIANTWVHRGLLGWALVGVVSRMLLRPGRADRVIAPCRGRAVLRFPRVVLTPGCRAGRRVQRRRRPGPG